MQEQITNIQVEDFLQDYKLNAKLEFLEEGSKEKNELINSAKKRGILVEGSRDLGILKTVFLFTDKPNANNAIVPSKEFKVKFPQIVGKAMNLGHNRQQIIGFYIDFRYIQKENKAITYAIFFKSNYPDLYKKANKFLKKGKLSSSFEIWSNNKDKTYNKDGSYILNNLELAGGALIFEENGDMPAFKDAKVLSLAKKINLNEYIDNKCLVVAFKHKCTELLTDTGKLECSNCGRCKKQEKAMEVKEEVKKEKVDTVKEVTPVPTINKVKCSNCQADVEFNGVDIKLKCSKCFAILNKEGVMQYPPQITDFRLSCPACSVQNWLIIKKTDNKARLQCQSCSKEYSIEFAVDNIDVKEKLKQFNFVYTGTVNCLQCSHSITISGISGVSDRKIKCSKCGIKFLYNTSYEKYKTIVSIEEIVSNKIEKSSEKGGKKTMEFKLEVSKYHRKIDDFDKYEKTLLNDYGKSKDIAKQLTTEERNALPDNMFAVVVRIKDKRTGKTRKIRMFPIHDEAHVRNALVRLPQAKETLQKLGVSLESVKVKILRRARQLKMTELLKRQEKASEKTKVEPKKITEKVVNKVEDTIKVKAKVEKVKETPKIELKPVVKEAPKTEDKSLTKEQVEKSHKEKVLVLENKIKDLEKELKEKVKFYKANAKELIKRREELGDFAEDLTDEQIMDAKDYKIAQLEKSNVEKKVKDDNLESASEVVGDVGKSKDYYSKKRDEIDNKAFNK